MLSLRLTCGVLLLVVVNALQSAVCPLLKDHGLTNGIRVICPGSESLKLSHTAVSHTEASCLKLAEYSRGGAVGNVCGSKGN